MILRAIGDRSSCWCLDRASLGSNGALAETRVGTGDVRDGDLVGVDDQVDSEANRVVDDSINSAAQKSKPHPQVGDSGGCKGFVGDGSTNGKCLMRERG